jgi:outer membrane protein insertion porin family
MSFAQGTQPAQVSAPTVEPAGPELILLLSVELSTETGNAATLAGRVIRTEMMSPGDRLELEPRVSRLRKELGIRYVAPTSLLGFQLATQEVTVAETSRFIAEQRKLSTAQASARALWSRATSMGIVGIGVGAEALRLDNQPNSAPYLAEYISRHGRTSHNIPLLAFWANDKRIGDQVLPSGHFNRLNIEWGTRAGSVSYTKADLQHQSYLEIHPRLAAGLNASVGALRGLNGDLTPLTKRYFGGGVGTVRGYESGAISPTDLSGSGIGANRQALLTVEALWHAFSIGETPVILSAFADYGRFWDVGSSSVANDTDASASSYGLGVSLPVRIGLVRFSFARPRDTDLRTQRFQFDARANWR